MRARVCYLCRRRRTTTFSAVSYKPYDKIRASNARNTDILASVNATKEVEPFALHLNDMGTIDSNHRLLERTKFEISFLICWPAPGVPGMTE